MEHCKWRKFERRKETEEGRVPVSDDGFDDPKIEFQELDTEIAER
jgi:hypothetical protein